MSTRLRSQRRVRLWHGILLGTLLGAVHALLSDAARPEEQRVSADGGVKATVVLSVTTR